MKISRESWHYRTMRFSYSKMISEWSWDREGEPKSLCGYFWKFLAYNGFFVFVVAMLSVIVFMFTLGVPILAWSAFVNGSPKAFGFLLGILFIYLIFGGGFLYMYAKENWYRVQQWYGEKKEAQAPVAKGLSLVQVGFETVRATKNRFCPRIEYLGEGK